MAGRPAASRPLPPGGPEATLAAVAGLSPRVCRHTFRATGIAAYLEAGGIIEKAQHIAAHESAKATTLRLNAEPLV